MSEFDLIFAQVKPWFDMRISYLPGTIFGTTVGLWGATVGILSSKRWAYPFLLSTGIVACVIALGMLILGTIGLLTGQPYAIWYALILPGAIGTIQMPFFLWMIIIRHRSTELLKLASEDL